MSENNTASKSTTPAYIAFLAQLTDKCAELGVPVETWELKNFVGIKSKVNDHKVYVPKHAQEVRVLDTTVPCNMQLPGFIPLKAPNGKIQAQFKPDMALIEEYLLPALADSADRLPPNKKPAPRSK